jgi:hypothetical protein
LEEAEGGCLYQLEIIIGLINSCSIGGFKKVGDAPFSVTPSGAVVEGSRVRCMEKSRRKL